MESKRKKLNKFGKIIINIMLSKAYIGYLINEKPDMKIVWQGKIFTPTQADRLLKKLFKVRESHEHDRFIEFICLHAQGDKEFWNWYEMEQNTCEECGCYPIEKRFLKKYEPEYEKFRQEFFKNSKLYSLKERKRHYPQIERFYCPGCKDISFAAGGTYREEGSWK